MGLEGPRDLLWRRRGWRVEVGKLRCRCIGLVSFLLLFLPFPLVPAVDLRASATMTASPSNTLDMSPVLALFRFFFFLIFFPLSFTFLVAVCVCERELIPYRLMVLALLHLEYL